jgi:hypothetical protein
LAFLIIESGPESGRKIALTGPLVVGRQAKVGLSIPDAKASREHARIEPAAGGWVVLDLESSNGTMLNGRRITREFVQPGDRVTVGQTVMRFEMEEATGSATTRPLKETGGKIPTTTDMTPGSMPMGMPRQAPHSTPPPAPPQAPARAADPGPTPEVALRGPTLRYQDKGGGVGIVGVLVCLAVLAGLVFASKWIGQKAIGKVMEERKAGGKP